jgi:hypothetical protein
MPKTKPEPILYASDARGIYIPQHFAQTIAQRALTGVSAEDYAVLEAGPDHEHYWDVWEDVLREAVVTDEGGQKFALYQDGDLWLIPEGMEWNDNEEWFFWSDENPDGEHDGQPDEAQEWHDFDPDC